jgi:hypothetical protein
LLMDDSNIPDDREQLYAAMDALECYSRWQGRFEEGQPIFRPAAGKISRVAADGEQRALARIPA